MTTWAERKRTELIAKCASMSDELDYWSKLAHDEQKPPAKHHTQIARVHDELAPVTRRLGCVIRSADVLAEWRWLERAVLDLHRVWGFFRDKMVLRQVELFVPYLLAADELAWACYQPAQDAGVKSGTVSTAAVREPPLVGLASVASPFSIPRGTSYMADVGGSQLTTARSRAIAERLPIPVIGVPWFQLRHLPDALVIAHEVGHHVERDLGLTDRLRLLVARALDDELARRDWTRWASESFADVYGVLCTGLPFAVALSDFLVVARGAAPVGRGSYPPLPLRLALVRATVQRTLGETLRGVFDGHLAEGVDSSAVAMRRGQAEAVARALLEGPYPELGNCALSDVVCFDVAKTANCNSEARRLIEGRPLTTRDIRTLFAAAASAYASEPQAYTRDAVAGRVLAHARQIQEPGLRATPQLKSAERARADRMAAKDFSQLLISRPKRRGLRQ